MIINFPSDAKPMDFFEKNDINSAMATLEKLKKTDGSQKEEIKQGCLQFETIILNLMTKTMRETTQSSDLFDEGMGEDIYFSMFDQSVCDEWIKNKNLGIANILFKQLTGEDMK